MGLLTAPQTLSYNGVTFNSSQVVGTGFHFVYDAGERTVVETICALKVKAKIVDGGTQDTTLAAIRAALERPGGQLVYTGMGFGGLNINTGADRQDLNWGPKPRTLTWQPVGARAANIEWVVEISLLGCADAPFDGAVMEATHELQISTDNGGYLTRVHTGKIRIPMTRIAVGNARVPDNVDNYVDDWIPLKPANCNRTISKNIAANKASMTFTVTDTERAGWSLPAGVVEAEASHNLASDEKYVGVRWRGTISATYEVEAGRARSEAWEAFKKLIADRVGAETNLKRTAFPTSLVMGEPQIYGKQSGSFTLTYNLWQSDGPGPSGKEVRFLPAGLFRQTPGATHELWSQSLKDKAQHDRGVSRLVQNIADDRLVDLCLNSTDSLPSRKGWQITTLKGALPPDAWDQIKRTLKIYDSPPAAATWLNYRCLPCVMPIDHVAPHVPLPTGSEGFDSILRTPSNGWFPQSTPLYQLIAQRTPAPIIQSRSSTSYYVYLRGEALRYAYEIPRPVLSSIGNSPCVEINDPAAGCYWESGLVGSTTHPIFAARWCLRWFVARLDGAPPSVIPILGHPDQQAAIPQR